MTYVTSYKILAFAITSKNCLFISELDLRQRKRNADLTNGKMSGGFGFSREAVRVKVKVST